LLQQRKRHCGKVRGNGKTWSVEQSFIYSKQIHWLAFYKRLQQDYVPESFKVIVSVVEEFLAPLIALHSQDKAKPLIWSASGSWSS